MKANELRVGNCFYELVNIQCGSIKSIIILDEDMMEVFMGARNYDSIEPIPLTPEILERCGFGLNTFSKDWIEYEKGIIGFDFNNHSLGDCHIGCEEYHYLNIKYLHQLQNLYFALTNSELEIKNIIEV